MSTDATAVAGTCRDAPFANPLVELEAREARIARNLQSLDTGAQQEAIGEELRVIQERRLYQAAGIKSFQGYLDTRRNPISRGRAYQLMKFFDARRRAALAGSPMPANERQTRAAKAGVNLSDPFEQLWIPVFKYLQKKYLSCPTLERVRFVRTLEVAAQFFSFRRMREAAEQNKDKNRVSPDPSFAGKTPQEEIFSKRSQSTNYWQFNRQFLSKQLCL